MCPDSQGQNRTKEGEVGSRVESATLPTRGEEGRADTHVEVLDEKGGERDGKRGGGCGEKNDKYKVSNTTLSDTAKENAGEGGLWFEVSAYTGRIHVHGNALGKGQPLGSVRAEVPCIFCKRAQKLLQKSSIFPSKEPYLSIYGNVHGKGQPL